MRYAAVVISDDPLVCEQLDAFASDPKQDSPFCERACCRAWGFYSGAVGVVYRRPEFEEHAAIRMVADCHDDPRDVMAA